MRILPPVEPAGDPVKAHALGERIANSVTHGVGLAASLVALPLLVVSSLQRGDALHVTGATIFGVSLVLLYAASTVYHSFPQTPSTRLLRVIDHSAIYVLIAGSYTPFMLGPLRGRLGYTLRAIVWAMAVVGIAMKTLRGFGRPALTAVPYVAMGWLSAVAAKPLIDRVGTAGFWWLLAGGLFYTGGVVFYATDKRLRYGHAVWHLFVLAGSTCHFFAVLWHSTRVTS
ncbi:MAG TPA: hemolysin III family protein [Gemmatimonadaceae bacterium]